MKLLAIDTAADLCAACVFDTQSGELGRSVLDIGKGHAEHLMAVVTEALRAAGTTYADVDGIAVSIGPGSFTGVRVGVAAARGFALALKIPAIGVTTLEAVAAETAGDWPGRSVMVAIGSRPESLSVQLFDGSGTTLIEPSTMPAQAAAKEALRVGAVLAGNGARLVAQAVDGGFDLGPAAATADIATYARIASARNFDGPPPKPLYLREPDAKPQAGFALARKDR